jgi:adenine-specific DNA methylase
MAAKKDAIAREVAKAVGAGKPAALETVDFGDPNRLKTCLEVDFPILPVNQVAGIEGNAGKPIYQMSKWWARRRSSVFRSMLIAAATRAPEDPAKAAKLVWENYYANHQKKGAFKHLTVADIFMGGGTTLVEGSRLGMQMFGNDLNPVAWFVVKQEFAKVDIEEVKRLLADIEAEVKPQIMPFYYCDGPNGERGKWTHAPTGRIEGPDFDPLSLSPEQRKDYKYQGPEIIYAFWAKHGPCQMTGCGHRTPIMNSNVVAVKSLTVKHWPITCKTCNAEFDVEEREARMAPNVPLLVAATEKPYTILEAKAVVVCPQCGERYDASLGKGKNKKIELSLLMHPDWLAGSAGKDKHGRAFGGSAQDDPDSTGRWNMERAKSSGLLEVRGTLPATVTCPETNATFRAGKEGGTIPKKSNFACAACGATQDVLASVKATAKIGPMGAYAFQGYSARADIDGSSYGGRFFGICGTGYAKQFNAALDEWERRKSTDLKAYWPTSEVPFGFMTGLNNGDIRLGHGFTHWWTMFNPRQMLVHAQLLRAILNVGTYTWEAREFVLGGFQQYLRNQNLFTLWNMSADKLEPMFANNNFHPKSTVVENSVFAPMGRGNWQSCADGILEGREWAQAPWEVVSVERLRQSSTFDGASAKGVKTQIGDPVQSARVEQASSTELGMLRDGEFDLVITDPPFGGLLHYSELSDFFYVWLRIALKDKYPREFGPEFTPKSLEAVANRAREPEDPDGYYQRLLTECWREAHRVLKPGGLLAFTFHHSEDEPWVAVLESLFDAGFYLEAAYPIRSDETKGEGSKPGTFGSQQIEFDIVHVCRKRTEEPAAVSWARMRREVLADVRQLQSMLENHAKEGLPEADLQVIKRGKALEYFSRHYGKIFKSDGEPITVKEALVGINQILNEDATGVKDPPPVSAEPMTRQFLRIFDGHTEIARDQMQKFLRGSGMAPDDFVQRGWCGERNKIFFHAEAVAFARDWHGRHRRRLTADLDQALVLIGACFDESGVNAADTLKNENFKPHPALKGLLGWYAKRGANQAMRNAAIRALTIYNNWAASHRAEVKQMSFFFGEGEAA